MANFCADSWSEEEQRSLDETLQLFPAEAHSLITQCAQAAARLPARSVRDVGVRLYELEAQRGAADAPRSAGGPQFADAGLSRQLASALAGNVHLITEMRENLNNINLMENVRLMRQFDFNVRTCFALLDTVDIKMPAFPVQVNTMFLNGGDQQ
ncbi:hypothetical protein M885DRAFT_523881 [Pelagophyceae sp. CCMP2097]|nr:hypothetical protein M885DRAFT_523881 [Pelagophyceae sp. CCMP2097]